MRFETSDIPFLVLLFYPLWIAYNGFGIFTTIFLMIIWLLLRQMIVMSSMTSRVKDKRIILESLPISHYVEKVRWCLDYLGEDYEEIPDIGIFGAIFFGRSVPVLKIPSQNVSIGNSSNILRYLYGANAHDPEKAEFLKPTPEAIEWEKKLDKFAEDARRFVYYHVMIKSPKADEVTIALWGLHNENIPQWQRMLLKVAYPALKKMLTVKQNITKDGAESALSDVKALMKQVDDTLADGRKYILKTDKPTFVDFAFATYASILIEMPQSYAGRAMDPATRRVYDANPSEAVGKVGKEFMKMPSGKFIQRMYEEHRKCWKV